MPQEEEEEVLRPASVEKHETRKYEYEAEIALARSQADHMPQEEEEEVLRQARFFKVATFCFDYCFAHSWHSLDEPQEVVTGNSFHFTVWRNMKPGNMSMKQKLPWRSQADYMPQEEEEEEEVLRQASPKKKMNIFLRMKTASSEWSMFLFSFFFLALFSLIMFIV
ncbi:uncharacterized protein ACNLHF_023366 [Anomaloglossus baeobatrachus]